MAISTLNYRGPGRIKPPKDMGWMVRRIAFRIGLFVLLSPAAFYFGPNLINYHKLTRLSPEDFTAEVEKNGVPVVRALLQFKQDEGRWPDDLNELVPRYIAALPDQSLDIRSSSGFPWPQFVFYDRYHRQQITYNFPPGNESWEISGSLVHGRLPLPPVTLPSSTQPSK